MKSYEDECLFEAKIHISDASKLITSIIGVEGRKGTEADTKKMSILEMMRDDLMNVEFAMLKYKKCFRTEADKEAVK